MRKGPRFIWFNPSRIIGGGFKETENGYIFEGSIETFRALGEGFIWQRKVAVNMELNEFVIKDTIKNKPDGMNLRQIWHTCSDIVGFESTGNREDKTGWYSDYYGVKIENKQIEFITKGYESRTIACSKQYIFARII